MPQGKPLSSMVTFWNEYVEHCGGKEEADMRLGELMRMDMDGPMPDEISDVDVSACFDSKAVENTRESVKESFAGNDYTDPDVTQANLLVGKLPVNDAAE